MTVAPNRNSLIRLLVKVWVSVIPPKRSRKGMSSGKFKLFAEATPPVWIWKESAPKGKNCSESVQKKRKEKRSLLPRNSLSQLVVNWLSVNLPGELTIRGAVLTLALHVPVEGLFGSGVNTFVTPGVPATEGISQPPPTPGPN